MGQGLLTLPFIAAIDNKEVNMNKVAIMIDCTSSILVEIDKCFRTGD
jgi:hypothetical protein